MAGCSGLVPALGIPYPEIPRVHLMTHIRLANAWAKAGSNRVQVMPFTLTNSQVTNVIDRLHYIRNSRFTYITLLAV